MRHEKHHPRIEKEGETAPCEEKGLEAEPDKLAADMAALNAELEQLQTDVQDTQEKYLRALADFDNFRKRQREETARQVGYAREEIITKLLPILDNLERSVQAAEGQHSYDVLVEGVTLTLRQFRDALEKAGVEPIEAVGQEFNPELHEAMASVNTDEYPEHTVVDEFEKGYTLNGRVLRPSRVRVAMQG